MPQVYMSASAPVGVFLPSRSLRRGPPPSQSSQRTSRTPAKRSNRTRVACASAAASGHLVAADKKQLGDSDLMVTACCLGTMTWGRQNTEDEAHQQLAYALDMGVNFVDAAEVYPIPMEQAIAGLTELYIGTWLRQQRREDVVLATKMVGFGPGMGFLRCMEGQTTRVDEQHIVAAVEGSLRRLQTDYIDLLQIHWPDRYLPLFGRGTYDAAYEREDVPFEVQLQALEKLIHHGKVRHIGVSNESAYGVMRFTQAAKEQGLPKIASIQNVYNLLARGQFETDLAEVCAPRQCNVGLLAYSPLARGVLTGKYAGQRDTETSRLLDWQTRSVGGEGYLDRYNNEGPARTATDKYLQVARKYGLTMTQLALAWCKSRWFVTSSVIGATSLGQLKENLEAFNTDLPEECIADINAIHFLHRDPAIWPA